MRVKRFYSYKFIKSMVLDTYDRLTLAGCFSPGHMDYRHIKQLVRLLKPGLNIPKYNFEHL